MVFNNLFADGKANARARILGAAVQPLKNLKNALEVFGRDSNTVIPNGEKPFLVLVLRPHVDVGRLFISELDGVADEVLKQ